MAEPHKTREPAINRENKASAMRLGIGLVVVLVLGVVVWVIANPRSEPLDLTPQHQPGAEDQSTVNQPPARSTPRRPPAAAPARNSGSAGPARLVRVDLCTSPGLTDRPVSAKLTDHGAN
jgi:hypothetical protein